MSNKINIEKTVFDKSSFGKVVDTEFRQLLNNEESQPEPQTTVDFFKLYNDLFYQIPKEGDIDSHRYILDRELEYLGLELSTDNFQLLLDEITNLRQQLLDAETTINEISKS